MKIISSSHLLILASGLFLTSCATQNAKYGKNIAANHFDKPMEKDSISHTFFLVGDAGNADQHHAKIILEQLQSKLKQADNNSTILFLGDNIYPHGLPDLGDKNRPLAQEKLDDQIAMVKDFKGKTIFVPGNHDWYSNGIVGLKNQQDYVIEQLKDKKAFAPKNACAIETRKLGTDIALIIIDTEWFLADWDKNPGINENCDFKTREDLFTEFEDQLNKNQDKTIIVATHHPLLDHGSHGGYYSLEKQIFPLENKFPLPVLGSAVNLIRATGGITHQDLSNPNYRKLSARLRALMGNRNNIVVVSGHDHNLQYIEKDNIKQIISGAGSKSEAATTVGPYDFSYGKNGYAVLQVSKSGNADIAFFGRENDAEKLLLNRRIINNSEPSSNHYNNQFPATTTTSVYDKNLTQKSQFYQFLWGKHYRDVYSTPINAPTLDLDTLLGGSKAYRSGGGHQTNSLRLRTKSGGEYVIRALKKSGVRFLQSVAFKDQYIVDDFKDGFADKFLLDFYTTSHPYTPLVLKNLADKIDVQHTNPQLYYVPKQNGLGKFNSDFGNELYYLEIRPTETDDNPNKILDTNEVIQLLAKDEKYKIDEKSYIRARLFDLLIGDWDRHYDQWKWEQKQVGNDFYFFPIPKDRDQAFVKYDGIVTKLVMTLPALRHMKSFKSKINNLKWFNREPYPLDLVFTRNSTDQDWISEAQFIQDRLNDDAINSAFSNLPKEVQNQESETIKSLLKIRQKDLQTYASQYYKILQKTVVLAGTNKKDKFVINRLPNKDTEINIIRLKTTGEQKVFSKTYSKKQTSEIWLYGLDDDDVFQINGEKKGIKLRLIGGLNHDNYDLPEITNNVSIYDYKSKNNTFSKSNIRPTLTDDYEINQYQYEHPKFDIFQTGFNIGYNPDDDIKIGVTTSFTKNGFKQNPFTSKHAIVANYFTGTKGYELAYHGIFPKLTGHWFYQLDAKLTSALFLRNFFGIGNLTANFDEELGKDYNRIRAQQANISPSINWKKNAAQFSAKLTYDALKIQKTNHRFISNTEMVTEDVFSTKHFGGLDLAFNFKNLNKAAHPTLGMQFDLETSYKLNLKDTNKQVPEISTGLGFIHYLTKNEKVIISTYAKAKWLLSDDYEFYQMTTLGGNDNLRGYRFDRFYGKTSYYHTTDLRVDLGTFRNSLLPINVELFGGFDYGRVWIPTQTTSKWHNSYGLGLSFNALDQLALKTSWFRSTDGGRFVIGFGMNF